MDCRTENDTGMKDSEEDEEDEDADINDGMSGVSDASKKHDAKMIAESSSEPSK